MCRLLLVKVTTELVDTNNVTFFKPTEVYMYEACEYRMGNFHMSGIT